MNDRFFDLNRLRGTANDDLDELELDSAIRSNDIKKSKGGYGNGKLIPDESLFVDDLFQATEDIKDSIAAIEENVIELQSLSNKALSSVQNDKNLKKLKEQMSHLETTIKSDIAKARKGLERMKNENAQAKQKNPKSAEVRLRENQYASLTEQLMTAATEFTEVQEKRKDAQEENLVRLVTVAMGDSMSEDEIQEKVRSGDIQMENIFSQRLAVSDGYTIKATYNQAIETKKDLESLESSMEELYEMFRDMHDIVALQASLLDNIEQNLEKSIAYVEQGTKNLKTARKIQAKARCSLM